MFVVPRVVDVPIYDEWLWAPLVIDASRGTLHIAQLWQEQNAHRSPFPTAIALVLARFSSWDVRWEIAASLVVALLTLALLVRLLPPGRRSLGAVVLSMILFGPAQIENWTWGFQLSWFLVNFGIVATVAALRTPTRPRVALAAAAAIVASLSLVSGFAAWAAGAVMLTDGRTRGALAWWLGIALAVAIAFLVGYHVPGTEGAHLADGSWSAIALGVPTLLGAAVAGIAGTEVSIGAALIGLVAALVLARAVPRDGRPWLAVLAATVIAAAIVATARAGEGLDELLTSRYATLGALFWSTIAALAMTARLQLRVLRITYPLAALLAVLWIGTAMKGAASLSGIVALQHAELSRVERIAAGAAASLTDFAPDPRAAVTAVAPLRAAHLGPFRQRSSIGT